MADHKRNGNIKEKLGITDDSTLMALNKVHIRSIHRAGARALGSLGEIPAL
jgi:hypothetical protein